MKLHKAELASKLPLDKMPLGDRPPDSLHSMFVCMSHDLCTGRTGCDATYSPRTLHMGHHLYTESLLVLLQGMQTVRVLHNALGSPSAPQAAPALVAKAKTFQKAKSLLSFRHQASTAASLGSSRSSMLPAAYPPLLPGDLHQQPVLQIGIPCKGIGGANPP